MSALASPRVVLARPSGAAAGPAAGRPAKLTIRGAGSVAGGSSSSDESAVGLIWSAPPNEPETPALHLIVRATEQGPYAIGQLTPALVPSGLHPDTLNNTSFTLAVAQTLLTKKARLSTMGMVLTAAYLPSQLDTMADLAAKQQLATQAFFSEHEGRRMHVVLHRPRPGEEDANRLKPGALAALEAALGGPLQPLSADALQVARLAEQGLWQQLRLFDPATWSFVLQQSLQARRAPSSSLVVRSLMAPRDLDAAQQLVERMGLHFLELPDDAMQAQSASRGGSGGGGTTGGGSSSDRRRSRKAVASTAAARGSDADGRGSTTASEAPQPPPVVVVISRDEMTPGEAAELPIEWFTDYQLNVEWGGPASAASGGTGGNDDGDTKRGSGLLGAFFSASRG